MGPAEWAWLHASGAALSVRRGARGVAAPASTVAPATPATAAASAQAAAAAAASAASAASATAYAALLEEVAARRRQLHSDTSSSIVIVGRAVGR